MLYVEDRAYWKLNLLLITAPLQYNRVDDNKQVSEVAAQSKAQRKCIKAGYIYLSNDGSWKLE